MYCVNCGTPVPEGQKLCENCMKGYQNVVNPQSEMQQAPNNSGYNVNPQPQGYNPYTPPASYVPEPRKVVTVGQWILRSLITLIPCVGGLVYFIMLFVWMNDKKYEESSANWAKAQLIWLAISIGLALIVYLFVFIVMGITLSDLTNEYYYY